MELLCYLHAGWEPRIRPASQRREWMDATQSAFAYRCLPLNIANAHGWEILVPCGFEAVWRGGSSPEAIEIRGDGGGAAHRLPVSIFGNATLTFHIEGLFRTPPGWNLWIGGSPNSAKDGIAPLNGIVETDWAPYTFTMNWRFTRPGHVIRFEENEPFCFFFPIQRHAIEAAEPRYLPLEEEPELMNQFRLWSDSRNALVEKVAQDPGMPTNEQWQKLYYRGLGPDGRPGPEDHKSKLRLATFKSSQEAPAPGLCPFSQGSVPDPLPKASSMT